MARNSPPDARAPVPGASRAACRRSRRRSAMIVTSIRATIRLITIISATRKGKNLTAIASVITMSSPSGMFGSCPRNRSMLVSKSGTSFRSTRRRCRMRRNRRSHWRKAKPVRYRIRYSLSNVSAFAHAALRNGTSPTHDPLENRCRHRIEATMRSTDRILLTGQNKSGEGKSAAALQAALRRRLRRASAGIEQLELNFP